MPEVTQREGTESGPGVHLSHLWLGGLLEATVILATCANVTLLC